MPIKRTSPAENANKATKPGSKPSAKTRVAAKKTAARKSPRQNVAASAVGAPSKYTPEIGAAICAHIADCIPLRAIAAMPGMPVVSTMMLWLDGRNAAFSEQYRRAREAQADKMADDMLTIADEEVTMVKRSKHAPGGGDDEADVEVVFDPTAVARNRLRVDARKWLASKMAPKKYGDKIEATHQGPNGGPIQARIAVEFVRPAPPAEKAAAETKLFEEFAANAASAAP